MRLSIKRKKRINKKSLCGKVRLKYNLTQSLMAKALHVSNQCIYYFECRKKRTNMDAKTKAILERMLKIRNQKHILDVKGCIHSKSNMYDFLIILFSGDD